MKRIITTLFTALVAIGTYAQTASVVLEKNNSSITLLNGGDFFWDLSTRKYAVPKTSKTSSNKSTIFSGAIWISGLDADNELHLAVMTYRQSGKEFYVGPSSNDTTKTRAKYDQIYVVSQSDITNFKIGSSVTTDILNWPGNGDTSIGEPWQLAPFVDQNNNGVYETDKGDYPSIKGEVAAYCIYNDNDVHNESGGKALNVDVHQMFYQDKLGANGGLFNETNLAFFKIVNRSTETYHDLKFGIFVDFELGGGLDDYIGSDSNLNMAYVYNADNNDDGIFGFGLNPPSQNVMFLNKKAAAVAFYLNNFNTTNGNPRKPEDYNNLLSGRLTNGKPLSDHHGVLAKNTRFAYNGDPTKTVGWSEMVVKNKAGDRRAVLVAESVTIAPGESTCYDVAFVYGRDTSGHLDSYKKMKDVATKVQDAYDKNYGSWASYSCSGATLNLPEIETKRLGVFPNPSTGVFKIEGLYDIGDLIVINSLGQILDVELNDNNEIDLSDFADGVYFIKSAYLTAKIIKQ